MGTILDDGEPGEGSESFMLRITTVEPHDAQILHRTTAINIVDSDGRLHAMSLCHM